MDIFPKKKNEMLTDPYTTANTMAALDFDTNDVCEELKTITVKDYAETILDDRNVAAPPGICILQEYSDKRCVY